MRPGGLGYSQPVMERADEAASELAPGDRVGRYVVEALVGEGGMGRVYRARRDGDGAILAVKVMKPHLVANEESRLRFLREARAAREVEHKHLVGVEDAGEAGGVPYIAMRLASGGSLEDRLRSAGPLPFDELPRLVAGVASGLDALHVKGIVHRDVKPSNVLLDEDGSAALTDFGIAKGADYTVLTRVDEVLGTLDYMAPELIRGETQGPPSDIYALGCLVFECLAGRPPFSGKGVFGVGLGHLDDTPPDPCAERPDAPAGLSEVVLMALEKDAARRPPTATAYAQMLVITCRPSPALGAQRTRSHRGVG